MFRISTFFGHPFSYHCFFSWLFPVNKDEIMWLAGQLQPLSCYCTAQLCRALSFTMWGWLPLCFMKWDPLSITWCISYFNKMGNVHWSMFMQPLLLSKSNKYYILWVCVCSLRFEHAMCLCHMWFVACPAL